MVVTGYEHHRKVYVAAGDVPVDPNCPRQWPIKTRITRPAPETARPLRPPSR
jgi:hypothetical protein